MSNPRFHIPVYEDVLSTLGPIAGLIHGNIIRFEQLGKEAFFSRKWVAEKIGVSEATIKREIKRLYEAGFIDIEYRPGKTSIYRDRYSIQPDPGQSDPRLGSERPDTRVRVTREQEQRNRNKEQDNVVVSEIEETEEIAPLYMNYALDMNASHPKAYAMKCQERGVLERKPRKREARPERDYLKGLEGYDF